MKLNKHLFIILIILVLENNSQAQSNYSDGYLISLEDDTISGKIKDGWRRFQMNRKPIKIRFIGQDGKSKSYLASEIKGYSKADTANYISLRYLNEGPFYAKIILQGEITLLCSGVLDQNIYNLKTFKNRYFFLRKNKKTIIEIFPLGFRSYMMDYFSDDVELKKLIENKELKYCDLENIVNLYNEWFKSK